MAGVGNSGCCRAGLRRHHNMQNALATLWQADQGRSRSESRFARIPRTCSDENDSMGFILGFIGQPGSLQKNGTDEMQGRCPPVT